MENSTENRYISRIEVQDLFGRFNYTIPNFLSAPSLPSGTMLLYGDNGCGKTTILRLIFHTLATAERAGHRTYLSKTKFRQLTIYFSDGTAVSVEKKNTDLLGTFHMRISKPGLPEAYHLFEADEDHTIPARDRESESYYKFSTSLSEIGLSLYFLTDTRTIMVDQPDTKLSRRRRVFPADEELRYREMLLTSPIKALEPEEVARRLVRTSVHRVISEIRSLSIMASSLSESNVNTLYREIIRRVVDSPSPAVDLDKSRKDIIARIETLQKNSARFARFGLLPRFIGKEILTNVENSPEERMEVLSTVLSPYLDSIESKFKTLSNLQERLELFVNSINRFYQGKEMRLHVRRGLSFLSQDREMIPPEDLSSGERQLLLLFCNTMITLNTPSLMLIDEPELSLNIKWQRALIPSLLELVSNSPIQFIFATHSFEILSKYMDNVTKLESVSDSQDD